MEKKTPWWYYLLFGLSISGLINTYGDYTLEGRVSKILSLIIFLVFGFLITKKK